MTGILHSVFCILYFAFALLGPPEPQPLSPEHGGEGLPPVDIAAEWLAARRWRKAGP
jgi:hypothetical protein